MQHNFDDELIGLLCEAAVDRALAEIGLAGELEGLRTRTVPAAISRFPLPIAQVTKLHRGGVELDAQNWKLSGNANSGQFLEIAESEWQAGGKIEITYEPGFDPVPSWFLVACLFLVGHYYENRSSVAIGAGVSTIEVPMGFHHLLKPHKRVFFA